MTEITQYAPLWGAWQVDSLIGEGSFGKVYKVRREEFGKTYYSAVKLITIPQSEADLRQIRGEGMDDASLRSYFHAFVADIIQEIDLMSEFRGNSNIVSFEDHKVIEKAGQIGWDILIRMELLTSLTEHVINKPLSQEEIIKLGIHICRALELCGLKNTIHRDIKPDNIFVSQYGEYKLGDFGIARQVERTTSGLSKKGTYTYMAPEVFAGQDYGPSVDTYSLGIVMYRFLNQNRTSFLPDFPTPITPKDRDDALHRRMRGEALPHIPGVDPALNAIVQKACNYDRKARFISPTEMREALENISGHASYAPVDISRGGSYSENSRYEATGKTASTFDDIPYHETTSKTVGVFDDMPHDETTSRIDDTYPATQANTYDAEQTSTCDEEQINTYNEGQSKTSDRGTHRKNSLIKIAAISAATVILALLIFWGYGHFIAGPNNNTRINEAREHMNNYINSISGEFAVFMTERRAHLRAIADLLEEHSPDIYILNDYVALDPAVEGGFIERPDGTVQFTDGSGSTQVRDSRPPVSENQVIIEQPVVSEDGTYAIGVIISLEWLIDLIRSHRGDYFYLFLTDAELNILYHLNHGLIGQHISAEAWELGQGILQFSRGDTNYYYSYAGISGMDGWRIWGVVRTRDGMWGESLIPFPTDPNTGHPIVSLPGENEEASPDERPENLPGLPNGPQDGSLAEPPTTPDEPTTPGNNEESPQDEPMHDEPNMPDDGNLTGQPPISFEEIAEWGWPYGATADELVGGRLGVTQEDVDHAIFAFRYSEFDSFTLVTSGSMDNPAGNFQGIIGRDMVLWHLFVVDATAESQILRWHLGMTLYEVVSSIPINNPDILAVAQNPTQETFERYGERTEFDSWVLRNLPIPFEAEDGSRSFDFNITFTSDEYGERIGLHMRIHNQDRWFAHFATLQNNEVTQITLQSSR